MRDAGDTARVGLGSMSGTAGRMAPVILTKRDLTRRRSQIYRDLGTTPAALNAKARSTEPLTDAEFSAIEELREIKFLLGG